MTTATEIVLPVLDGWIRRDLFDTVINFRRDPQYSRAYTFDFAGPDLVVEVTAWPHSDQDAEIATYALRDGVLRYGGGDDVSIPDKDLPVVTSIAAQLDLLG
jgi:hypothetical protein